jgi:hypothetical protein
MADKSKFDKVMREFKAGTLNSSSGQKVTSHKQALAIAFSESGMSRAAEGDLYTGPVLSVVGDRSPKDKEYDSKEYLLTIPGEGGVTVVAKMKKGEKPTQGKGLQAILKQVFDTVPHKAQGGLAVGAGNQPPGHASTIADGGIAPIPPRAVGAPYPGHASTIAEPGGVIPAAALQGRPWPVASSVNRAPRPAWDYQRPVGAAQRNVMRTPQYRAAQQGSVGHPGATTQMARSGGGQGLQNKWDNPFTPGSFQGFPGLQGILGQLLGGAGSTMIPEPVVSTAQPPPTATSTPEQDTIAQWIASNPNLAQYFNKGNLAQAGMKGGATITPMEKYRREVSGIRAMAGGATTTAAPTLPAEFMNLPFLQSLLSGQRGSQYQKMTGTAQPFGAGVGMPNWQGMNYYEYMKRPDWQRQMTQGISSAFGMPPEQMEEQSKRATLNTLGNPVSSQYVAGVRR